MAIVLIILSLISAFACISTIRENPDRGACFSKQSMVIDDLFDYAKEVPTPLPTIFTERELQEVIDEKSKLPR